MYNIYIYLYINKNHEESLYSFSFFFFTNVILPNGNLYTDSHKTFLSLNYTSLIILVALASRRLTPEHTYFPTYSSTSSTRFLKVLFYRELQRLIYFLEKEQEQKQLMFFSRFHVLQRSHFPAFLNRFTIKSSRTNIPFKRANRVSQTRNGIRLAAKTAFAPTERNSRCE